MEDKINKILNDINEEISTYSGDNLYEDSLIDSFQVIDLISELEDTFDITIDASLVIKENFVNKNAIFNLVRRLINEQH